jgi:hypothetical protein
MHKDGSPSFLCLDNNYNPTFGLPHEHHDRDAVEWTGIGNEGRKIQPYVLSPVDLAVTKISRYSIQDREDILALANASLFSVEQLRNRATEALRDYVGDRGPVMTSIELTCRHIVSSNTQQVYREPEFPIDPPRAREGKERELDI